MKRALLLLLLACGPHDAESVTFGDGGRPPRRGEACSSNTDCADFEFCEMNECTSSNGFCAPRMCLPMGGPVCGCDGKTYATNCERKRAGVSGFVPGTCQ